MHSRIFQMDVEPISNDYLLRESDIEKCEFIGPIADYISEDVDRKDDIEWLLKHLSSFDSIEFNDKDDSITFSEGFKEKYFARAYKELTKAIDNLSLEEFSGNDSYITLYRIKNAIENKFGFYVYVDEEHFMTFDSFIRGMSYGVPYYIGSVLDYHS